MPSPDIFGPELSIADIFVTAVPSIQIWASSSQRTQCFPPELYSWQGGGASESPHLLKKAQETPGRARCLNGKLITPKLDKRAKKTRTTVLSKTEGQIWQKNVTKRSVSFLPGEHEGRNVGFSTRAIAAMLSQKSSRRPGEEFLTKGQKGERRWFIWKCLSVIMMSCFPAHRVQPRCGMKECQGQRQTQDSDCALESDEGSAINFLFSPYMHVSENAFLKRALRASFCDICSHFRRNPLRIAMHSHRLPRELLIGEWRPNQSEEEGGEFGGKGCVCVGGGANLSQS